MKTSPILSIAGQAAAWLLLSCAAFQANAIDLDESPAHPGEWGYRPGDGAEVLRNPPPFTWRPVKGAAGYQLQIARDSAFAAIEFDRSSIPWSAHCPDRVFAAGTYYWRYAAIDMDGTMSGWSAARSFRVGENATTYPQPTAVALAQRLPGSHPRLYFRPEDISRFRELAQGTLSDAWKNVQNQAEKLLAEPPDYTEPPLYPPGIEVKGEQWREIWWGNRLHAIAVADGAATLAFAYVISGDERYGQAAREGLMALTKWDPEGSTQYRYNDEAAMPLLKMPPRAYTWVYDLLSESDRQAVVDMMRVRGRQCYEHLTGRNHLWRPYASHSNRAWHFLGEVATAFHGEIPEAETWLDFAMTVMYTAYPVWGDADGGWHEGTGYWSSYLSRFMFWAFVARSAYDIDVFELPYFSQAGYYGMYTLPPGSKTGGFSDQGGHVMDERVAPLMRLLAAGAGNPHWAWYADTVGAGYGSGYLGFIYAANAREVSPKPPDDLPSSRVFHGTGLALLNTELTDGRNNIQVHFKSSPMGRQSHGYNANNAFLLNIGGKQALLDSGRRDVHGSPHHYEWMHHSKSDNAILVNGESQIKHHARSTGRITLFDTSPGVDIVVGEAGDSYESLDRWTRTLVFFKPRTIVILDELEAPAPSTYQWNLHAKGAFGITENGATWEGDAGKLRVTFLDTTDNPLTITQTDQFEPPPAEWAGFDLNEWHLTAATDEKRAQQTFLTLIQVEGDGAMDLVDQVDGVRLQNAAGEVRFEVKDGEKTVIADGFSKSW